MDVINTECINKQNIETFNIFKKRKNNYPSDLAADEIDITKKDFSASKLEFEPPRKKLKLSISERNNEVKEALDTTDQTKEIKDLKNQSSEQIICMQNRTGLPPNKSIVSKSIEKINRPEKVKNVIKTKSTKKNVLQSKQQTNTIDKLFKKCVDLPNKEQGNDPSKNNILTDSIKLIESKNTNNRRNSKQGSGQNVNAKEDTQIEEKAKSPNPKKPTRKLKEKKFTKLNKLTKQQIKNKVLTRKIPKHRLDDALNMINDINHPVWEDRNTSCQTSIHLYWESRLSLITEQHMKIKYARQFLLRKDWISLSKVLSSSISGAKAHFPLLSKYAALLMAHTDKEQFNKIVQFLTSVDDSSTVLKKCTKISKENEE